MDAYQFSDVLQRIATLIQSDSFAKDYGTGKSYTSMEVHTISYIAENPGCLGKDIAYQWGKSTSAVSQILKRLKSQELIYTQKSPDNLKNQCLYLTEKGKQLDTLHRHYDEKMQEELLAYLKKNFSHENLDTMLQILQSYVHFYCEAKAKK